VEASATELSEQIAFLRAWVEHHRHEGGEQWYVDEHVVDVDANMLWQVVEHALRLWHQRVPRDTCQVTPVVSRDTHDRA